MGGRGAKSKVEYASIGSSGGNMRLSTSLPYEPVGKLSHVGVLEKEYGKLNSNEVVRTFEREGHINKRHPEVDELFGKTIGQILGQPDYILSDPRHEDTIVVLKNIDGIETKAVVKLSIKEKHPSWVKNSVLSFSLLRPRTKEQELRKKNILYKRRGL